MIAIVDYQAGNLASVKKAFDHIGANSTVTSDPQVVAEADKIVVPGVGNFLATKALESCGIREMIAGRIADGTPFLGICLGMQWLMQASDESSDLEGLGIWPERCSKFPVDVKSPHVGWNRLEIREGTSRLLRDIPTGTFMYFTHSFRVPVFKVTVAECDYGGCFSAAIERDNIFGVQFHPEKSGQTGLKIVENFCNL